MQVSTDMSQVGVALFSTFLTYFLSFQFSGFTFILAPNIANCAIWLWNMVSYIKGGTQAKGIWKQDPEANIWMRMVSGEGSTMSNFIDVPFT